MAPYFALLLLPEPPQRHNDLYDIWAALYPPLSAAVSELRKHASTSQPATLEIALPIVRLVQTLSDHDTLVENVAILLGNVYSLLAYIYKQEGLELDGHSLVDSRVLLVAGEKTPSATSRPLPFGTTSYEDLSRFHHQWTHVFAVDGENGQSVHRKFRYAAAEADDRWCPELVRVSGGFQMFIPNPHSGSDGEDANALMDDSLMSNVLVVLDDKPFGLAAKYTLTMAIFSMAAMPSHGAMLLDKGMTTEQNMAYIITANGDLTTERLSHTQKHKAVLEFLLALLDFGEPKTVGTWTPAPESGYDMPAAVLSVEKPSRLKCLIAPTPNALNEGHADLTSIVVERSSSDLAKDINQSRAAQGWKELRVVKVGLVNGAIFEGLADEL